MSNGQRQTGSFGRFAALIVFATFSLAVMACTKSAAPAKTQSASSSALQPVKSADVFRLASAPGAQLSVVNVWATWCSPCQEEMPALARFQKAWADRGVRVILVSADEREDQGKAAEFLKTSGVEFPTFILDESPAAFVAGFRPDWTGGLPATFILDTKGRILTYWIGKSTLSELEAKARPRRPAAASPASAGSTLKSGAK